MVPSSRLFTKFSIWNCNLSNLHFLLESIYFYFHFLLFYFLIPFLIPFDELCIVPTFDIYKRYLDLRKTRRTKCEYSLLKGNWIQLDLWGKFGRQIICSLFIKLIYVTSLSWDTQIFSMFSKIDSSQVSWTT